MNDSFQTLMKKEADDVIFDTMTFDDRLKEKVREKISVEQKPSDARFESTRRKFKWHRKLAAACVVLMIASVPLLQQWMSDSDVPVAIDHHDPVTEDTPSLLLDPETDAPSTWTFTSIHEAMSQFSEQLLVPTSLTDEWHLMIQGLGPNRMQLDKVELHFSKENAFVRVIAEHAIDEGMLGTYEPIQIRGQQGMKSVDSLMPSLSWTENGIRYTLTGTLTEDELIDVAEMMRTVQ